MFSHAYARNACVDYVVSSIMTQFRDLTLKSMLSVSRRAQICEGVAGQSRRLLSIAFPVLYMV